MKKDSGQAGMTEVGQGSLSINVAIVMNSLVTMNIIQTKRLRCLKQLSPSFLIQTPHDVPMEDKHSHSTPRFSTVADHCEVPYESTILNHPSLHAIIQMKINKSIIIQKINKKRP
jgi:hypothetical protein